MKEVFIMLISCGLTIGASAQHFYHRGGYGYARPRISIGIGAYLPLYPYYGGYGPFYCPRPYGYGYGGRPSKLALQIEEINNDYKDRIWAVRHDRSLPRKERKVKVHELKHEWENAIIDAKRNFYSY